MSSGRNQTTRRLAAAGLLVACLIQIAAPAVRGENIDPDSDGSQYAWTENAGWLNAEPAGCGGCGVQVTDSGLSGWMWGENVGWISLSCANTGSCAAVSYGVANDGHGNLSGFAWAENAGWINFDPATAGATIDPVTGEFGGRAWSENLGWIGFSCVTTGSCATVDYRVRTDWCRASGPLPAGTPQIAASRAGDDVQLSWSALSGAAWYDIVRGDVGELRVSEGDYVAATGSCVGDSVPLTTAVVSGTPNPAPGEGFWYLVRGANCRGKGTYDSGGGGQIGARDAEIEASTGACP